MTKNKNGTNMLEQMITFKKKQDKNMNYVKKKKWQTTEDEN